MKNELTLDELLRDPLVLTVMRADRVNPGHLRRELREIGGRFNNGARGRSVPGWFAAGKAGRQGEGCTW